MHRNSKQTTNNPTTKQTRQLYNKRKPHKNNKRLRKHLNLKQLEFTKTTPQQEGRPAYPPETLLKLWIYGHHNKIRSADN
jgi:transposase